VRLPAKAVETHVEARRTQLAASSDDEPAFSMGRCWACLNYCDPETLDVRPGTSEEAALMVRFWDARDLVGVVPLLPGDVPPELATLAAERIGLLNSRGLGGTLTVMDPEEVRFLMDMNLAAGRTYKLEEQVGMSPLKFNAKGLETIMTFMGNPDVNLKLGGSIPMAGATCPLDPRGAAVQATAERLALDILCAVLDIEGPGPKIRIEPFDLRYSTIVFGSPEWCLYIGMALSMNEFLLGRKARAGMFRSTAKGPDPQAACERMASVLFQALMGVRVFGAVGQLSIDEVFSPQQAIIDGEILAYAARVVKGFDWGCGDSVEMIREGMAEGAFVGTADTMARFREFYHFSDLFRHWNVGRWRSEGSPSVLSEAWARAQETIGQSTFELEPAQRAQVERLYSQAEEYIRTRA
jgi:trimethylamine:corrinoid methyltransferase-like protein